MRRAVLYPACRAFDPQRSARQPGIRNDRPFPRQARRDQRQIVGVEADHPFVIGAREHGDRAFDACRQRLGIERIRDQRGLAKRKDGILQSLA